MTSNNPVEASYKVGYLVQHYLECESASNHILSIFSNDAESQNVEDILTIYSSVAFTENTQCFFYLSQVQFQQQLIELNYK